MKLLVTGGTGFIGSALCRTLAQRGHEVLVLTRSSERRSAEGPIRFLGWQGPEWRQGLAGADAVVNLAGEPIAAKRWSPRQKQRIRESRIETTRRLVEAMAAGSRRPPALLNASAIGYYGDRRDDEVTESDPPGSDFLARTCEAWEAEADRARSLGVRVVRLRIGIVLERQGGALAKMTPPFQGFLGGPLGSGRQWMSWVHRDDIVGMIDWLLAHPEVGGAVNATAPHPVRMRDFCRELGRVLHRPSWAPVPGPILRVLLGEMADMLLTGQRVLPRAATNAGYAFRFPELGPALAACFARPLSSAAPVR